MLKIRYHVENLTGFLSRLRDYIPLLWKDRDWDYCYLLDMIELKLGRMERLFTESDIHEQNPQVAQEIKYTRDLISKIRGDGKSHKKLQENLKSRFGDLQMHTIPSKHFGGYRECVFTHEKAKTKLENRRAREIRQEIDLLQAQVDKRNWQKLGNVFRYKLTKWWD